MLGLVPRGSRVALVCRAGERGDRSRKGKQFEQKNRRRGRPAWKRSPYDTPLRDGNRDRLIGLLTERATKTLMIYLMELNPIHYSWLVEYYKENPIPRVGTWDDVSGETFLRTLLSMPVETATYKSGRDELYSNQRVMGVDPRNMAMRIMEIRSQLAKEFISDLQEVAEENSTLMRETLSTSLMGSISFGSDSSGSTAADAAAAAAAAPGSVSESSDDGSVPASGASTPPLHPELVEAELEARARAEAEASAATDAERLRRRQRQLDEEARQRGLEESARRDAELRAARREAEAAAAAAEAAGLQGEEEDKEKAARAESSAEDQTAFGELGMDAAAVVAALNAAFARDLPLDAMGSGDHPELGGSGEGGGDSSGSFDGGSGAKNE